MRIDGTAVHISIYLPFYQRSYSHRAYLRLCEAVGAKARELSTSGMRLINAPTLHHVNTP